MQWSVLIEVETTIGVGLEEAEGAVQCSVGVGVGVNGLSSTL